MTKGLQGRIFGIFVGSLCGYIIGWALGWSFFDPNLDVWALAALVGALLGLCLGLSSHFWKWAGILICSTICLYLGWILRTLVFGDVPGGVGVFFILGGAVAGVLIGRHPVFREDNLAFRVLTLGLIVGYFGGLLIDWALMKNLGVMSEEPSIVLHAPAVIFSGLLGAVCGILFTKLKHKGGSQSGE